MTYHHLSQSDKDEIFEDRCAAFEGDIISENEFKSELAKLGFNATEIETVVRHYRPEPPENADGDAD